MRRAGASPGGRLEPAALHRAGPLLNACLQGGGLPERPPVPTAPPPTKQVVADSLTLSRIARNLRRRRFEGGALRLDNVKLYFKLDADGNPEGYGIYEQVRRALHKLLI